MQRHAVAIVTILLAAACWYVVLTSQPPQGWPAPPPRRGGVRTMARRAAKALRHRVIAQVTRPPAPEAI